MQDETSAKESDVRRFPKLGRIIKLGTVMTGAMLVAIQLVPYGRAHANPPVTKEPDWIQASTRELAVRACFDCHSNETRWPWYTHVAPMSWLVQRHVEEGRTVLNFSEWNRPYEEAGEASEAVLEGEMPLWSYLLAHPSARLTATETQALARGLAAVTGPPKASSTEHEPD